MPDRTKAPKIRDIRGLSLAEPELYRLDNGIRVHVINLGAQEVLKLEIIFFAGRPYEEKKLVARATVGMLKEGTRDYDSAAIADKLDFYGSSLNFPFNLDTSDVVLYSLTKHFGKVLPVFAQMLTAPTFPEEELQNFIKRNKHRLQVDLQRTDIVAYRQITENIFGTEHPYGYNSYLETYDKLLRADLVRHFKRCYNSRNCLLLLSGRVDDKILSLLNGHLGFGIPEGKIRQPRLEGEGLPPGKVRIDHPGTVQAAIRIGRRLFNRRHPDFAGMYVLNTVLGGYFGSRLMANIREDKGYTYNIYSMLDTMVHDGLLYIATEVGNEFVEDTLSQIYREIEILQEILIDEKELEMVRNYLLGSFLTMIDGPFNVSEVVKSLLVESLPVTFFEEWVNAVKMIRPKQLRELAQRYLQPEDLWEVVVGEQETGRGQ
jgi:zinc protease